MRIITEPKELIARYVARRANTSTNFGAFAAVALINDEDELMAGAIFNGYRHPNIFMQIAAEKMTPGFVAAIIHYPFVQLKCKRMTGLIHKKNNASRRFAKHLGARLEGNMKDAAPDDDILIYGLMRADAMKWLKASRKMVLA